MNKKTVGVTLIILALIIGVLAWVNAPKTAITKGTLAIVKAKETIKTFTIQDIKTMPSIKFYKQIKSASFASESGNYIGVPLRELLNKADKNLLTKGTQVITRAEDGFVSAFTAEEVTESDNIVVIYSKNGKDIGSIKSGGSGPLRVLVRNDPFGNRSTKYLYQIEVR